MTPWGRPHFWGHKSQGTFPAPRPAGCYFWSQWTSPSNETMGPRPTRSSWRRQQSEVWSPALACRRSA